MLACFLCFDLSCPACLITATSNDVQNVWSFLPYAYAASFGAESWKSTMFDPRNDVIVNNVHVAMLGMSQLFKSFPFKADAATEFIKASSFFLLRMKNTDAFAAYPLRAMCIFLDKFVSETGIVGRAVLQENVPYVILHSSFVDLTALGIK